MIALLVIIIFLILFLMIGMVFLTLKQRELNPLPEISCPKCPDPPKVVCPELPELECPKCPECPESQDIECPKCPELSEIQIGFLVDPKNNNMKKLFKIISELTGLFQDMFCSKKQMIKKIIRNMEIPEIPDSCSNILLNIKESLLKDAKKQKELDIEWMPSDKHIDDVTSKLVELFELIFPDLICKGNKVSPKLVRQKMIEIIDSFCD